MYVANRNPRVDDLPTSGSFLRKWTKAGFYFERGRYTESVQFDDSEFKEKKFKK